VCGLSSQVGALFAVVKDGIRATLLNGVLGGFTAYNTAVTNLLLAELVKQRGGNPDIDVEELVKASKDIVYSVSNSLLEIAEEHLTRREVEEIKRYTDTLQKLTK
jgi:arginine/lysine/ornithine decarboxylase